MSRTACTFDMKLRKAVRPSQHFGIT